MNGSTWLIVNLVLLLGAAASLISMRSLARPELPPLTRSESDTKGPRTAPPEAPLPSRPQADLRSDELWEKSLFRPERSEAPDEGDAATANLPAEKSNFELTGLAWIGKVGEAKPVAVIRYNASPTANSRRRVPSQPRRPGTPPEPAETEKPQKLVYAQGDMIGDTGYVLAEISTATNSVTLKRGNEHIDLTIEFGNSDSSQRKSDAVSAEQDRRRQREQQAAALIPPPTTPPALPPGHNPPAAPGQNPPAAPGQTAAATETQPTAAPGSLPPPPPGTAATTPAATSRFRSRQGSTTEATPGSVDRNQAQAIRERILQQQRPSNSSR